MLSKFQLLKSSLRSLRDAYRKSEVEPWPNLIYPSIELSYWHPKNAVNFGDELSRVVVDLMLAERGYTMWDELRAERHLLAVGSNLHFAREGTIVWGGGVHPSYLQRAHNFDRLDVRAVRGERTAEFLRARGVSVPNIFGDPALLLPQLTCGRFTKSGRIPVAFVPNLNDDFYDARFGDIPVISPLQSWNRCVAQILDCQFIMASSLHALVIAEAWEIPARYVRLSEAEGIFKYEDYYSGTGRNHFTFARSLPEAMEMGGEVPPTFDCEALTSAFPYDVWEESALG